MHDTRGRHSRAAEAVIMGSLTIPSRTSPPLLKIIAEGAYLSAILFLLPRIGRQPGLRAGRGQEGWQQCLDLIVPDGCCQHVLCVLEVAADSNYHRMEQSAHEIEVFRWSCLIRTCVQRQSSGPKRKDMSCARTGRVQALSFFKGAVLFTNIQDPETRKRPYFRELPACQNKLLSLKQLVDEEKSYNVFFGCNQNCQLLALEKF